MGRSRRRLQRLDDVLSDVSRLLILTHDNPDPDALAAGWVLRHIVRQRHGLPATLCYEGVVGRAENRAMVDLLRIPLVPLSPRVLERHDAIALIDTQPLTGNNSLPADRLPQLVFDHHPLRRATRDVPFADVRPDYGATATIMNEYLDASGLPILPRYATALFYAIRSETQNLGREASTPDQRAFLSLFPRTDNRLVSRIERAPLSRRYLALLDGAFRATRL
jgi:nanoRNase/pAp phosphatase (c-di-AMP/oligoRNAs hydrolase)